MGDKSQGKGKRKGLPPPPPADRSKGKGKSRELTLDTAAPNRPRMATLQTDGDTIEGFTASGHVLFSVASFDERIMVRALKLQIEQAIVGDAFKVRVTLLNEGAPMEDDEFISDPNDIVVKWTKGWTKVVTSNEHTNAYEEKVGGIALPVETGSLSFMALRQKVVDDLCSIWEAERDEQHRRVLQATGVDLRSIAMRLEASAAQGQKGPPLLESNCMHKPVIVTGFRVTKGTPGKSWGLIVSDEEKRGGIALPMETEVQDFQELRHAYIEFQLSRRFPLYDECKARETHEYAAAQYCQQARQTIRITPAAGPSANLNIPRERTVDIYATVRNHLKNSRVNLACEQPQNIAQQLPELTAAAFGFCVDVNLGGSELQCIIEWIETSDHERVTQHSSVGKPFASEADRLGLSLDEVLPLLEVKALDCDGRLLSYSFHPRQAANYVDPSCIVHDIRVLFLVGAHALHGLPQQSPQDTDMPSAINLCGFALNPKSYNEHKRLALEALAIQATSESSDLSANAKKGLVTMGCLLAATEWDAAVREQAQELLLAVMTPDSLKFMEMFYERHRYPIGARITQEVRAHCTS